MQLQTSNSPPTYMNARLYPLLAEPIVRVVGYGYVVDMGRGVQPRLHTVHKDRACNCGDSGCPAIALVAEWLKDGRVERAPDPPPGYTAFLPRRCPVCAARVFADHSLSSRRRGLGWQCSLGGAQHYWLHKWEGVKGWFFRDEIVPGLARDALVVKGQMGYLPASNQHSRRLAEKSSDTLEPVIVDAGFAQCGNARAPLGHVWESDVIPPLDDLPCLCGRLTWQIGVRLTLARHQAEREQYDGFESTSGGLP